MRCVNMLVNDAQICMLDRRLNIDKVWKLLGYVDTEGRVTGDSLHWVTRAAIESCLGKRKDRIG